MQRTAPVCSSAPKQWDGFLVEEHPPAEWESRDVFLLNNVVFLTLNDLTDLDWTGGGKSFSRRLKSWQISILPANHLYSVKLRACAGSIVVSLEQKLLSYAAAEQGVFEDIEPIWVHGIDDSLARELVLALRAEARNPQHDNTGYAHSLACMLASHIVRRYSSDRLQMPSRPGGLAISSLRTVIEYIHAHISDDIAIEQLAGLVNLSVAHFSRMFKRSAGMPPHQYVLRCRITRAKQLLVSRSINLAEVAAMAGFFDQGHMTRSFREWLGTTPGAYAQSICMGAGRK